MAKVPNAVEKLPGSPLCLGRNKILATVLSSSS